MTAVMSSPVVTLPFRPERNREHPPPRRAVERGLRPGDRRSKNACSAAGDRAFPAGMPARVMPMTGRGAAEQGQTEVSPRCWTWRFSFQGLKICQKAGRICLRNRHPDVTGASADRAAGRRTWPGGGRHGINCAAPQMGNAVNEQTVAVYGEAPAQAV